MEIKQIGIIHTPFKTRAETPIQPFRSKAIGQVEVFKEYEEGLTDIEGFSHIILLYNFHKSEGYSLMVKPFLDDKLKGLFDTRAPKRPNQIGLSVVRLLIREENVLFVEGIDVLDGTPLIDIKPYVPNFEPNTEFKIGWLEGKIK